jgi:hypothetical protein
MSAMGFLVLTSMLATLSSLAAALMVVMMSALRLADNVSNYIGSIFLNCLPSLRSLLQNILEMGALFHTSHSVLDVLSPGNSHLLYIFIRRKKYITISKEYITLYILSENISEI